MGRSARSTPRHWLCGRPKAMGIRFDPSPQPNSRIRQDSSRGGVIPNSVAMVLSDQGGSQERGSRDKEFHQKGSPWLNSPLEMETSGFQIQAALSGRQYLNWASPSKMKNLSSQ